ncbi:MAG TPA: hypothetical protein VEB42_01120, partial [Chitinophagaceae bacterium]|nr:hypothetical protein [Chitinophagaceae bacterium]
MSLVNVDLTAQQVCAGTVTPAGDEEEVCPVPPDCNLNPELYKLVLTAYHLKNEITFEINKDAFVEAFK